MIKLTLSSILVYYIIICLNISKISGDCSDYNDNIKKCVEEKDHCYWLNGKCQYNNVDNNIIAKILTGIAIVLGAILAIIILIYIICCCGCTIYSYICSPCYRWIEIRKYTKISDQNINDYEI